MELVIAVSLIVIISGLAYPKLESAYQRVLLKTTADNLAAWIKYTQSRAIIKHLPHRILFSEKEYYVTAPPDKRSTAFERIQGRWGRAQKIPSRIAIENPAEIQFEPDGSISPVRIYMQSKEKYFTVSTQEQSGQVDVYDFKVEESFLEEEQPEGFNTN